MWSGVKLGHCSCDMAALSIVWMVLVRARLVILSQGESLWSGDFVLRLGCRRRPCVVEGLG
jgi:hypothetical protein